jgi:hypothetical protein
MPALTSDSSEDLNHEEPPPGHQPRERSAPVPNPDAMRRRKSVTHLRYFHRDATIVARSARADVRGAKHHINGTCARRKGDRGDEVRNAARHPGSGCVRMGKPPALRQSESRPSDHARTPQRAWPAQDPFSGSPRYHAVGSGKTLIALSESSHPQVEWTS